MDWINTLNLHSKDILYVQQDTYFAVVDQGRFKEKHEKMTLQHLKFIALKLMGFMIAELHEVTAVRWFSFYAAVAILFIAGTVLAQEESVSQGFNITFETSALERIVQDPQGVLDEEESFWKTERAQVCTQMWADYVNIAISRKRWRNQVSALTELTEEERDTNVLM